jgi:ATP-binding cassette, subfamily B, multidrug efflux pump
VSKPHTSFQRFHAALARLIRPYRRDFCIGLLATAASNGLAVLIPLTFRDGIDSIVRLGTSAPLLFYGLAVILLTIGKGGGDYLTHQRIAGMGQRIAYDLRNRIFAHLQSLSPAFFDRSNTGDIMSRATSDVESVRMFITWSLTTFLEMIFLFTASLVLMSLMSWQLTVLACALFPVLGYTVMRFRRRVRPRYLAVQEQYGHMATALQENLAGIRLIQAYRREQTETERFRELNQELFRRSMAAARERAVYLPAILGLGTATGGIILWFGGSQVIAGSLTLGEFVAFIGYVGLLSRPLIIMGWAISLAQRAVASLSRIEEILSTAPPLRVPAQTALTLAPSIAGVRQQPIVVFEGVEFAYNGRPILRGIDLQGRRGELVAITGPSGAGKSTIGHLIARLYEVSAGKVMLHGVDVRELPLQELRRHVALVPQETFLFSASVAENLAYGRPDATAEAIQRIARDTCLWEAIEAFPQGMATLVGERGITLSGGQKQRVALARALLYGGEVLVLDDPFSNVDAETEERLLETVCTVARERFVLLITHRIKTLQAADRIVLVADGRLVAEGTHQQLLAQGGLYRALYERQCLRESLAGGQIDARSRR